MIHSIHEITRPTAKSWIGVVGAAALLALVCLAVGPRSAYSAEKTQQVSRSLAKEMTAAQKALQASQWAEAIKQLDAALAKPPLTPFDVASIYRLRGFANIKLNNLKAGQADYEKALASGAVSAEEKSV
jgi:outer membrane protein assembly factor BamD (BamD/ComL family)